VIEDFDQVGLETADKIPKLAATKTSNPYSSPPPPSKKAKTHPEKKKKAFRYGTKAERQSDRKKAKLKRNKLHRK
jgi:hypothetical protein